MRLFCDLDGVLVLQTGRDNFDTMPWMPDGKILWHFIKPLRPIILSMLRPDIYARCAPQKMQWCVRELGSDVTVFVTQLTIGKAAHAEPGDILIDDDQTTHQHPWQQAGGVFLHHRSAPATIAMLKTLGVG